MEENKNIQNEQSTETSAPEATEKTGFFANKKNVYIASAIAAVAIIAGIVLAIVLGGSKTPVDNGGNDNSDNGGSGEDTAKSEFVYSNTAEVAEGSAADVLWNAFKDALADNAEASAEELANIVVTNPAIKFMGGSAPLEDDYYPGFDNYTITGYESGAMFMPMMGSIAFVGYVFELAEDADVDAFIETLADNCNPRWQICVEAEQVVASNVDNKVFFLMCPASLGGDDEGTGEIGDISGGIIYPVTLEEGTLGYSYWMSFEDIMFNGLVSTPFEIASELCAAGLSPYTLMPVELEAEQEFFAGFENYTITDYESGAIFSPVIGSVAFLGYIFQLEEGVDVANFISDLSANANPAWNVCVEADEVLVGAYGNTVFFLMCPASAE